jgi:FMN hydrolase / 5-amino-6-(5-phospho-D-ribitylamino)uracil phosphatase
VILLDVMSTLVYDPFYIEVPEAFGLTLSELLKGKDKTAWLEFERNEITEEQFFQRFFRDKAVVDGQKMFSVVEENYRYLEGIEDLLSRLQKNNRLATLSNYPIWYQRLEKKLRLSQYMEAMFVSYQLGVRKPDKQAYLIPAERMGVEPAQCIFVDDRKSNCDAAIVVGMEAIHFKDAHQLETELLRLGAL